MARIKNDPFVGSSANDVDIDAATFTRTIYNAQGDLAFIYDKLTGENGETATINHTGGGRGALIRAPILNQTGMRASLVVESGAIPSGGTDVFLAALPIRIPTGETTLSMQLLHAVPIEVGYNAAGTISDFTFELRNISTWAVVSSLECEETYTFGEPFVYKSATLTGLTAGQYIATVKMTNVGKNDTIYGVTIGWFKQRAGEAWLYAAGTDDVVDVDDPGTSPMKWRDIDASVIEDEQGLNAHMLTSIDRNINGLAEYLTGVPSGGDATLVHDDNSATAPTRSEFFAHTRAGFASEPVVDFPLVAGVCGAIACDVSKQMVAVDAAEPPTTGMTSYYTPWCISGAYSVFPVTLWKGQIFAPHFPLSSLSACALFVSISPNASFTQANWTITFTCGASTVSSSLTVVADGGLEQMWTASASGISFSPDAINECIITAHSSSSRAIAELCLVGFSFQWEV